MNQNGFHILIVDDEPNIRAGLAKGLSDEAAVVDTAKDGEEAAGEVRPHRAPTRDHRPEAAGCD